MHFTKYIYIYIYIYTDTLMFAIKEMIPGKNPKHLFFGTSGIWVCIGQLVLVLVLMLVLMLVFVSVLVCG